MVYPRGSEKEQASVALLKAGSIAGLETLVRLHQTQALKVACAITHHLAEAEDVVADAYLRAYDKIGGFDASRPFEPWFLQIVVNSAIRAARRPQILTRLLGRSSQLEPDVFVDPAETAERHEQAALVLQAMSCLSPKLRAVLVLRYFLELDQVEMATVLRCPEGTVKRRLHDARNKLRQLLIGRLAEETRQAQEVP